MGGAISTPKEGDLLLIRTSSAIAGACIPGDVARLIENNIRPHRRYALPSWNRVALIVTSPGATSRLALLEADGEGIHIRPLLARLYALRKAGCALAIRSLRSPSTSSSTATTTTMTALSKRQRANLNTILTIAAAQSSWFAPPVTDLEGRSVAAFSARVLAAAVGEPQAVRSMMLSSTGAITLRSTVHVSAVKRDALRAWIYDDAKASGGCSSSGVCDVDAAISAWFILIVLAELRLVSPIDTQRGGASNSTYVCAQ